MARLYRERKGELHIYRNRMPQSNGGDPLLGLAWFMGVCGFLWFLSVVLDFTAGGRNLVLLALGIIIIPNTLINVLWPCQRVVFSPKTGQAWFAILFFKWGRVPLEDFAGITLSDQEMMGKTHFAYVATRRDEFATPLRLSPRANSMDRLSRYYYEIIPLLAYMLEPYMKAQEEEEDADTFEVAVEEVEVTSEEASVALSDSAAFAVDSAQPDAVESEEEDSSRKTGKKDRSGALFRRQGNVYSRSLWLTNVTLLFIVFAIGVVGAGLLIAAIPERPIIFGCVGGFVGISVFMLYHLARENMDFTINTDHQVFRFRIWYGLKKCEYGFGKMGKFTVKSQVGLHTLCLELKGHKVDPTIIVTRSAKKAREAYIEVCRIIDVDPKKHWKA